MQKIRVLDIELENEKKHFLNKVLTRNVLSFANPHKKKTVSFTTVLHIAQADQQTEIYKSV